MASLNFEKSYEILIKFQPPYKNNEVNENLVENYGIYKKDFETQSGQTYNRDQYYDLTIDDFKPYFKAKFWDMCRCDDIFDGVDFLVFSYAIHSNSTTAIKKLQQVLGVPQTGIVDVATNTALANCDDAVKKTQILLDLQMFLSSEYSEEKFTKVKSHAQYLI